MSRLHHIVGQVLDNGDATDEVLLFLSDVIKTDQLYDM